MRILVLIILGLFFGSTLVAEERAINSRHETGYFSGRIVHVIGESKLVRVKVDFSNLKYLNKGNRVIFWGEENVGRECVADLMGKSNEYILLKVKNLDICKNFSLVSNGAWTKFYSEDLVKNIATGKDVYQILLKKHSAINSKLEENKNMMNGYVDKFEVVNQRYIILRQKLEEEWKKEIELLEKDRSAVYVENKSLEIELDNIVRKLEQYKIEDENLKTDRWALDANLFYKK